MQSFVGNKKLLGILLATLFAASSTLFADEHGSYVNELKALTQQTENFDKVVTIDDEEEEIVVDDDIIVKDDEDCYRDWDFSGLNATEDNLCIKPCNPCSLRNEVTEQDSLVAPALEKNLESLLDRFPQIFSRRNIVAIDTVGDPDGSHVKLFNPELSQLHTLTLKKDITRKERGLWEVEVGGKKVPGVRVIRHTKRVLGANIKFDKKFVGYRKYALGKLFEKLFGMQMHYRGNLLTDHYKNYPLWNVVLKDREELHKFITYLSTQNQRHRGTPFFDHKPILRLTLETDPFLETLELEDTALINTLFQLVDMNDAKTTDFFNTTLMKVDKIYQDFEASGPIYLGESVKQQVFRHVEKFFKDFDPTDLTAKIVISSGAMFLAYIIWKKIVGPIGDEIFPEITDTNFWKNLFNKNGATPETGQE